MGKLLRTFPAIQAPRSEDDSAEKRKQVIWPVLKWSSDDKYGPRVTPGVQISIYELPSTGLVDKKSKSKGLSA